MCLLLGLVGTGFIWSTILTLIFQPNLFSPNTINIGQNNLSGSIPSELAQLEKLTTIDFLTNSLTGTVPEELFTYTDMTYLNLGYNDLEGTISTKFGDLTKLSKFCLYGCMKYVCLLPYDFL